MSGRYESTSCGLCGSPNPPGFAEHNGQRFCHPDDAPGGQTCYMQGDPAILEGCPFCKARENDELPDVDAMVHWIAECPPYLSMLLGTKGRWANVRSMHFDEVHVFGLNDDGTMPEPNFTGFEAIMRGIEEEEQDGSVRSLSEQP